MSFADVDRKAWRALFAAQLGWMLDAMDFLLFTFAIIPIQNEFGLTKATHGQPATSVALVASAIGGMAFGRIADRIGRVRAMTISILLYSLRHRRAWPRRSALWQLIAWRVARRLRHGRRVVVRLGARRRDVAGEASRARRWASCSRDGPSARCSPPALSALDARALRLARALSHRRAAGGRRVLHPPQRRRAAGLARARARRRRAGSRSSRRSSGAARSSPRSSPAACSSRTGA